MGQEIILVDTQIDGKLVINNVPNSPGSIITLNPVTKELSTRTNAEIISDLGIGTNDFINKYSGNAVLNNGQWFITSNFSPGAEDKFTFRNGYASVEWGDSRMTFTDEGMIDLFQYGFRQEASTGENHLYYDTYFKNVNFLAAQGLRPFTVTSTTLVPNLNADMLDGFHASDFAKGSDLGIYYLKTGGVLSGRMDIISDNGVGSFRSSSAWSNYLTWNRHDNTGALAYIGADGGGASGGGIGYNFAIRAANGANLQLLSDTGNILANGEIVATRPWVDLFYTPKARKLTINGVTQDLSVDRTWNITGNYISRDILSGRPLTDANVPNVGTDFFYLTGSNKPQGSQDGVLQTFSFDNNQWFSQMYSDWRTNEWYVRVKNSGTWSLWQKLWHSGNFSTDNFIRVDTTASILDGSDTHPNQVWFDYNWAGDGKAGSVINFSGLGSGGRYNVELFGGYQDGNSFWLRNKNGDTGNWHDPVQILHTGNFTPGDYVKRSGDTLTGGGVIDSFGNITLQQNGAGLNATGQFWKTMDDTNNISGIGSLTQDGALVRTFMGWGSEPWDQSVNLTVSPTDFTYKGNRVWHGGNLDYSNYTDSRIVAPNHLGTHRFQFGFSGWNNDNSSQYADFIHFGGFENGTGGLQNLIMFRKTGFGLRQYQANSQDVNPYTNYVDYWNTGNLNPVRIGGTGTFSNPIYLGWDNNNVRITVDNSYIGNIWHNNNLDPVTRNTIQEIVARKIFSGAVGNSYDNSALMINGNGSNLFPTIGFHQSGIVGATVSVRNDSNLYYNDKIILHEGNINNYGFVTLSGAAQTIISQKTFNANVTLNANTYASNIFDTSSGWLLSNDVNGGDYGLFDQTQMTDLVAGTWNGMYCYGTEYGAYNGIMISKANKNVGINGIPGANPLKVHGAIEANGVVSNFNQSFDEIFTTDGSQRGVDTLGKITVQFNFDSDGQQHLIRLEPKHSLAVVPVTGCCIEDTMILLPKEARLGQEVEIINHSSTTIRVANQSNTGSPTNLTPGMTMRALYEFSAQPGDVNEDRFGGGAWYNVNVFKYNQL